ncbi:hypothetical protein F2Z80_13595 [Vibrio fortis]|uniref:Dystroglycan-type cadherin-like domain-containing protein n=1 Tax=Vibrio fortis TaxID=212667 RepID=A0A5N3S5J2_9VIBR|nr:putative Ig domain-containing protein [Vibrio fortis]KAB0302094.1 hypothetical protein F2Z80_13595 [Vibrio fortis]
MKKVSLLAASVAFALTGCGSDGDSSGAAPGGVVITAIDGYLQHAEVWVDTDGNFELDTSDKKLEVETDENGQFTLPNEHKDSVVFIKAIKDKTIDKTRGLVANDFELATTSGSTIINPMTNMVVEQLEAAKVAGTELTQEQAEEKVVKSVTDSGLTASQELIFGDYIADGTEEAQALNAIGETLVDNSDLTVEKQLELTDAVAVEAQAIIVDSSQEIDDFSPIVDVPADPTQPITVTPNSRPVDNKNGVLESITLEPSGVWVELDTSSYFQDADNDELAFELKELANDLNGLVIDSTTGIISGDLTKAGTYDYQIFAKDEHGILSYPLNLRVIKLAENLAPTVDNEEFLRLQSIVDQWQLQQGEVFEQTLDVASLFKDADGNIVKFRSGALSVEGLTISPKESTNSIITISGTPTKAYPSGGSFEVGGVDNDGEAIYVPFKLPEVLEGYTPPETHPLEGKTWYNLETGSSDGSGQEGASRVWCDSIKFENGIIYSNVRSLANKTSCSAADTQEELASYKVEGNKLIATFTSENGEDETHTVTATAADDIAKGAMTIVTSYTDEDDVLTSERYTYFAEASQAERRIQAKSDDGPMQRFGNMYIPAAKPGSDNRSMQLGRVSYAISDEGDANEPFDADIYFDVDNMNVTCDMINETFSNFIMTSDSGVTTDDWGCFDPIENEVEYAIVNFFPKSGQLVVGEVYSLIGYVENYDGKTEAVKFNIEWTGVANND